MGVGNGWNTPIALHNLADLLTFVSLKRGEILANVQASLSEGLPVRVPNQISNLFRRERHNVKPRHRFLRRKHNLAVGSKDIIARFLFYPCYHSSTTGIDLVLRQAPRQRQTRQYTIIGGYFQVASFKPNPLSIPNSCLNTCNFNTLCCSSLLQLCDRGLQTLRELGFDLGELLGKEPCQVLRIRGQGLTVLRLGCLICQHGVCLPIFFLPFPCSSSLAPARRHSYFHSR